MRPPLPREAFADHVLEFDKGVAFCDTLGGKHKGVHSVNTLGGKQKGYSFSEHPWQKTKGLRPT